MSEFFTPKSWYQSQKLRIGQALADHLRHGFKSGRVQVRSGHPTYSPHQLYQTVSDVLTWILVRHL